jgi:hypothetical protein
LTLRKLVIVKCAMTGEGSPKGHRQNAQSNKTLPVADPQQKFLREDDL